MAAELSGRDMPATSSEPNGPPNTVATVEMDDMARKAAEAQAAEGGKLAGTVHLKKCKPFPNPSIFSLAVFHFVGNLISHGYKENKAGRGLEHEDLWELHPSFQANNVKDTVNRLWAEELKKPKPSLGRVIVKMTWKHIVLSAIFEAIRLAGSFTGPILLREIILWIRDDNRSMTTGILFAVGMGLGSTAVAFGKSHAFHQALCTGITVKACFNTLVYQKALVLSNSARQKRTTGEIINLMSTDAENMFQVLPCVFRPCSCCLDSERAAETAHCARPDE